MSVDPLSNAARVVAAQEVTLTELRRLFDRVDLDLNDVMARETRVADSLDHLGSQMAEIRGRLQAMGVSIPDHETTDGSLPVDVTPDIGYRVPVVPRTDDPARLLAWAEERLRVMDIDLSRDPLLQVLPSEQVKESLNSFDQAHGTMHWTTTDWTVVLAAGATATLLDLILVRIPQDATFLGKRYAGSPLTRWLQDRDRASAVHARFLRRFESARVPYDAATTKATDGLVSGMRPATHRLQSLGHDPVLGFLFGVADIMRGTGTYIDKAGKLVQVGTDAAPVDLITAFITQTRHLLSDVATPAGLQPPLFSLLQLGRIQSPFALGPSGVEVPWTDVARYMYTHGYDLRHFFSMGITPGVVTAMIRGYWLLNSFANQETAEQRERGRAKLNSMLLVGHAIATSGTLLKTGLLFGMNPAALNYAQLMAMVPVTIAWLREAVSRDRKIERALEREWSCLLREAAQA